VVDPGVKDFNLEIFDVEDSDIAQVLLLAGSYPMMSGKRLVIIRGIQKLSETGREKLLGYAKNPVDTTCLLLIANKADRRVKLYETLTRLAAWAECKPLREDKAVDWVIEQCRAKGLQITQEAAVRLVDQTGSSLWALSNEIDKLSLFIRGNQLTIQDVLAVAGSSRAYMSWDLTDSVVRRDVPGTLGILASMLEAGQKPTSIIIDMAKRIEHLLHIMALKDQGVPEAQMHVPLKMHPYRAKLLMPQLEQFTHEELEQAAGILLEADYMIKTGRYDPAVLLTVAFYQMASGCECSRGVFDISRQG